MDKLRLRNSKIQLRKTLTIDSYEQIFESLSIIMQRHKVNFVHIYRSSKMLNEVDTNLVVAWLQSKYPDIIISQPGTSRNTHMTRASIDLIIAPVVAFDSTGNRIGMGGGWYDKFLSTQPNAVAVGFAYDECEVQKIEPESHDVRLDYVVTQTRLFDLHQLE